jgi:uncharacterized short protein YbdD (DUF466 family)
VDETIERARIRRAEQIAEKRDLITLADLEARLKEAQARANPLPEKPKKTKKEIYEEKFQEKYRGAFFAVDDICKHAIENARRDYPNNPVKLAQELAVVKMFRRDHLGDEGEQTE